MMCSDRRHAFTSLLLLIASCYMGLAIVYPYFTSMMLPANSPLHFNLPLGAELRLLVILMISFPVALLLGRFLIKPLMFKLPTKPLLIWTQVGVMLSLLLTGYSLHTAQFSLLCISRCLNGFFSSNLFIGLHIVSEIDKLQNAKASHLTIIGRVSAVTFIFGILCGGLFSNHLISPSFSPALPFWILSALVAITIIFLLTSLDLKALCFKCNTKTKSYFVPFFSSAKKLGPLYWTFFTSAAGWFATLQFIPADVILRLQAPKYYSSIFFFLAGTLWLVFSLSMPSLNEKLKNKNIYLLRVSLFISAVFLILGSKTQSLTYYMCVFLAAVIFMTLNFRTAMFLISQQMCISNREHILVLQQITLFICMLTAPVIVVGLGETFLHNLYIPNALLLITAFTLSFFLRKKSI